MPDTLNTPARILNNLRTAHERMDKVTGCLGADRLESFALTLSSLFVHQNPSLPGLASRLPTTNDGASLALYILSAGTELQSAWHILELGNIPGCQRTIRVAYEMLAVGVLCILPRSCVLQIKEPADVVRRIRSSSVPMFELCNAKHDRAQDKYEKPAIKATAATALFLSFLESPVQVNAALVGLLRHFRETLHHPFAHGSTEVWSQHFAGSTGNRAGMGFAVERIPLYRDCADGLIQITAALVSALDDVTAFLPPIAESKQSLEVG